MEQPHDHRAFNAAAVDDVSPEILDIRIKEMQKQIKKL
jgi:hypothetical protein